MTQIFTRTNDSKKGKRVFNLVLEQDNFHFDINKVFVQSFCFNFIIFWRGGGGGGCGCGYSVGTALIIYSKHL